MWLRNEDAALKKKLTGITVTDANSGQSGRTVAARFLTPEMELAQLSYPCILISGQNMERASDREHRGWAPVTYYPEGNPSGDSARLDPAVAPKAEFAVPVDVTYQITVMTRRIEHRMQIVTVLAGQDYLPMRFGYLAVEADSSVRSLFLDGGPEFSSAMDNDGKRVFMAHYVIKVPTEIPPVIPPDTEITEVVLTTTGR